MTNSLIIYCSAFLLVLTLILGAMVSIVRTKLNVLYAYPNEPDQILYKLVRAHANSTEYVPVVCLIFYLVNLVGITSVDELVILILTASRFLIIMGICIPKTMARPNWARTLGSFGTNFCALYLIGKVVVELFNM